MRTPAPPSCRAATRPSVGTSSQPRRPHSSAFSIELAITMSSTIAPRAAPAGQFRGGQRSAACRPHTHAISRLRSCRMQSTHREPEVVKTGDEGDQSVIKQCGRRAYTALLCWDRHRNQGKRPAALGRWAREGWHRRRRRPSLPPSATPHALPQTLQHCFNFSHQSHQSHSRAPGRLPSSPPLCATADTEDLSDKYTDVMQERMGSAVLTYRHEDGTNFSRILEDLIVGSCLQQPADVDRRVCVGAPGVGGGARGGGARAREAEAGGPCGGASPVLPTSAVSQWPAAVPPHATHAVPPLASSTTPSLPLPQGGGRRGCAHRAVPAGGQRHGLL